MKPLWWVLGGVFALVAVVVTLVLIITRVTAESPPVVIDPAALKAEYEAAKRAEETDLAAGRSRHATEEFFAKYEGKVLQITAEVSEVTRDSGGKIGAITFQKEGESMVVVCYFKEDSPPPDSIQAGEALTVQGRCTGTNRFVFTLKECRVVP